MDVVGGNGHYSDHRDAGWGYPGLSVCSDKLSAADTNADTNQNTHTDTDPHGYANTNQHVHTDTDPHGHTNADSHIYTDAN